MIQVFEENTEERRLKDEARAVQQQADMEAMKEYNRILDAQEQSRAAELEARMTLISPGSSMIRGVVDTLRFRGLC